jgi:hypothetical protein
MNLKCGEIYDLELKREELKGVYLGEKLARGRLKFKHVILTNKPTPLYHYTLLKFEDFKFEGNKLFISHYDKMQIPENQRFFYESLLETRIK